MNDLLNRVKITSGSGALTSLTDSGRQVHIDLAVQVWNELIDRLYEMPGVGPRPQEAGTDTITLVTDTREYSFPSDMVSIRWPLKDETNGHRIFEYCLAQEHRILTSDLRWMACGNLTAGDDILAFDEEVPDGHRLRRWRWAKIMRSVPAKKDCVRVHLDNGDSIVCTPDHPWLAGPTAKSAESLRRREWIRADQLMLEPYGNRREREGRYVSKPLSTWQRADSYDAGWLAGMFDGEGHISLRSSNCGCALGLSQKAGPLLDRAIAILREADFTVNAHEREEEIRTAVVQGGFAEILRALGTFAPQRLLANLRQGDIGLRQSIRAPNGGGVAKVAAVEPIGERDIQVITTSTSTYVGEGYLMHNCGGYMQMWRDQLQPAQYTGRPLYAAINPATNMLRMDRTPTSEENGLAFTLLYDKDNSLSLAADTFPFTDAVYRSLIPAAAEEFERRRSNDYDEKKFMTGLARASSFINKMPRRSHW